MDHLDRPKNPRFPQFKIPYICLTPYDNGEFLSYPARQGFSTTRVLEGDFTRTSNGESSVSNDLPAVQSFLQSWLFFGLIHEVHQIIGLPFDQGEFISEDALTDLGPGKSSGSIRRLNTESLPSLMFIWLESYRDLAFEDVRKLCRRIDECLQAVYKICRPLVRGGHTFINEDLLLSFMCLGNTIEHAMQVVFNRCYYDPLPDAQRKSVPSGWVPMKRGWDAPRSLFQKLVYSGWCPYEVEILKRDFYINEMIYATQLRRFGDEGRHTSCQGTACIANNIDEVTYRTQHRTHGIPCDKQNCQDVDFDYDFICEILRSGLTPIVSSTTTASGNLEFSIIPSIFDGSFGPMEGLKVPYICISHVWSHGMARGFRDQRVSGKVSFFWIDTICVPVRSVDVDLRKRAISNMAQIYEDAQHVLVLDQGLMRTSLKKHASIAVTNTSTSDDVIKQKELVMCILFSDWWRRLWTLQEGVLPDQLFVLFQEGVINLGVAVQNGADDHVKNLADLSSDRVKLGLHSLIDKSHVYVGNTLMDDRSPSKKDIEYRRRVLSLLCNRSTSRAADEPVCIATLMGLDPGILLETPGPERMQMLYTCLGRIPAGLVFLPVPKLEAESFRWAPQSLIRGPVSMSYMQVLLSEEEDSEADVTELGARLQATGYPLSTLGVPLKNDFYIFPGSPGHIPGGEDETELTMYDKVASGNLHVTAVIHFDQMKQDGFSSGRSEGVTAWSSIDESNLIDPVLILPKARRLDVAQNSGILASKAQEINGVWHARFLCNVHCFTNSMAMWGESDQSIAARLKHERAAVTAGARTGLMAWMVSGEPVREWCIS